MKIQIELKYLKIDKAHVKQEIIRRMDDIAGWVAITFMEE